MSISQYITQLTGLSGDFLAASLVVLTLNVALSLCLIIRSVIR